MSFFCYLTDFKAKNIHTAEADLIQDVINSSSPPSEAILLPQHMLMGICSLALDGDLPDGLLDLSLSPTDEDIHVLWRNIDIQSSIQQGEEQMGRRGVMILKNYGN